MRIVNNATTINLKKNQDIFYLHECAGSYANSWSEVAQIRGDSSNATLTVSNTKLGEVPKVAARAGDSALV